MGLKSRLLRLLGGKRKKLKRNQGVKTPAHISAAKQYQSPQTVFTGFTKTPGRGRREGEGQEVGFEFFSPNGVQKRLNFSLTGNVALLAPTTPSASRRDRSTEGEDSTTAASSSAAGGGRGEASAATTEDGSQRSVLSDAAAPEGEPGGPARLKKRLSVSFSIPPEDAPTGAAPEYPPPAPPLLDEGAAPPPLPARPPVTSPLRLRPLPPIPVPSPACPLPGKEAAASPAQPARRLPLRPQLPPVPPAAASEGAAGAPLAGRPSIKSRIVGRAEWAERVATELQDAERKFHELRIQLQADGRPGPAAGPAAGPSPAPAAPPAQTPSPRGGAELPASPLISISGTARNLPVKRQAELKRLIQSLIRCYVAADRQLAASLELASPGGEAAARPSDAFAALDALGAVDCDSARSSAAAASDRPAAGALLEPPEPSVRGSSSQGPARDAGGPSASGELLQQLLAARTRARKSAGRAKAALRSSIGGAAARPSLEHPPPAAASPGRRARSPAPGSAGRPARAPRVSWEREALLEIPLNSGIGRRIWDPLPAGAKGAARPLQPSVSALLRQPEYLSAQSAGEGLEARQ